MFQGASDRMATTSLGFRVLYGFDFRMYSLGFDTVSALGRMVWGLTRIRV